MYLKESTIEAAIVALKRLGNLRYFHHEAAAARELEHARRLSNTGATREEIEHVSDDDDAQGGP